MTIDDKIRDEKLQYTINREAKKTSALSSGKIDKYEHVTGEEVLILLLLIYLTLTAIKYTVSVHR